MGRLLLIIENCRVIPNSERFNVVGMFALFAYNDRFFIGDPGVPGVEAYISSTDYNALFISSCASLESI